eukprot:jgi/Botrbrau1/17896/Bobra.0432s0001.1
MLVSLTNLYCWRVLCAVPGNVVAWTVFPTGYEVTLPSCHHCRGTFPYAPPEWFLPGALPTSQSDIFAFGSFLYVLIEQERHIYYFDMEEHKKQYLAGNIFYEEPCGDDWPIELRTLVVSCIAFAPSDRPCLSDIIEKLEELRKQHSPAT